MPIIGGDPDLAGQGRRWLRASGTRWVLRLVPVLFLFGWVTGFLWVLVSGSV